MDDRSIALSEVHRAHGLQSGDAVLRAVVEAMRAGARAEDRVARYTDNHQPPRRTG